MLASFLSLFSFEFYCYLLYGLLLVAVQTCFNLVLGDEPYMDEIFHCRQTQVYCDHNFGNVEKVKGVGWGGA